MGRLCQKGDLSRVFQDIRSLVDKFKWVVVPA